MQYWTNISIFVQSDQGSSISTTKYNANDSMGLNKVLSVEEKT